MFREVSEDEGSGKELLDSPSKPSREKKTWCDYLTCDFRRLYCSRDKEHVKTLQFDPEDPEQTRSKTALQKLKF